MDKRSETNGREVSSVTEPGIQTASVEILTCHNYWCNYQTDEALSSCPECGQRLLTTQAYKLLGLLLVFLGGILALTGALLLILAAPKLLGGTGVKLFVWSVFGFLLAIGLTFMTAGFWQVVFGKRSQSLTTIVIALLITLMLIVGIGQTVL